MLVDERTARRQLGADDARIAAMSELSMFTFSVCYFFLVNLEMLCRVQEGCS